MNKSKTQQAIDWIAEDPKRTAYQAAKQFGISQAAISQARRKPPKQRCSCCGKPIH